MSLSDITIIYLAVGAPFGVHYFFNAQHSTSRWQTILKATAAMLLWPFEAIAKLSAHSPTTRRNLASAALSDDSLLSQKIELAQRELFDALSQFQDCAHKTFSEEPERLERAMWLIRESVEKYLGLTKAVAALDFDALPDARETEFCRVAGRTGDDLLLAGRCIHRRNAARLIEHETRARSELLHLLAELRDINHQTRFREAKDESRFRGVNNERRLRVCDKEGVTSGASAALLKTYAHAINLFSLLDDRRAAMSVARLLDAECARLRRLENLDVEEAHRQASGVEQCQTHTPISILTDTLPNQPQPQI
jgi:hypothetical protein